MLIDDLDAEIGDRVKRVNNFLGDLRAMVHTCSRFPNGLNVLVDLVRESEGPSTAIPALDFTLKTMGTSLKLSSDCWLSLQAMCQGSAVSSAALLRSWSTTFRRDVGLPLPRSFEAAIWALVQRNHEYLFEFLLRIAAAEPHLLRIRPWLSEADAELKNEPRLKQIADLISQADSEELVSLLVEVHRKPEDGTIGGNADGLQISRAWIMEGDSQPMPIYPPPDVTLADLEIAHAKSVMNALCKQAREFTAQPRVEIFAPRELLNQPYEEWEIKVGNTTAILGAQHPVVVRWNDRTEHRDLFPQWRKRWGHVKSAQEEGSFALLAPLHAIRLEEGPALMAELSDTTCPVLLMCCDPDKSAAEADVLRIALDAGTPILLWRRGPSDCVATRQALEKLVTQLDPAGVPEAVRKERQAQLVDSTASGRGIAILYDDPGRSPRPLRPRAPRGI